MKSSTTLIFSFIMLLLYMGKAKAQYKENIFSCNYNIKISNLENIKGHSLPSMKTFFKVVSDKSMQSIYRSETRNGMTGIPITQSDYYDFKLTDGLDGRLEASYFYFSEKGTIEVHSTISPEFVINAFNNSKNMEELKEIYGEIQLGDFNQDHIKLKGNMHGWIGIEISKSSFTLKDENRTQIIIESKCHEEKIIPNSTFESEHYEQLRSEISTESYCSAPDDLAKEIKKNKTFNNLLYKKKNKLLLLNEYNLFGFELDKNGMGEYVDIRVFYDSKAKYYSLSKRKKRKLMEACKLINLKL